jgi:DNA-binding CsgD family transcriptional regulator
MAPAKPLNQTLSELRRLGVARAARARNAEAVPLITQLLGSCRTIAIEERAGGLAFRLESLPAAADAVGFSLTCVLHHAAGIEELTAAEQAVAGQLCEGKTLAQIARLRGVSPNTVKSQVRQIFRKLNVESRVALARRMCP